MEKLIRTFIAIKIVPDNEFLHLYSILKESLTGESIKWVEKNNFHLTLRFLGDTKQNQTEQISLELAKITSRFQSFYLTFKGIGYFKSKGNPRVLFAKTEESQTLKNLANEMNQKVFELGFEENTRKFKSHLTLGRIRFLKNRNEFNELIKKFTETKIQTVYVSEIIFFKSILKSSGPIYKTLKVIKLKL